MGRRLFCASFIKMLLDIAKEGVLVGALGMIDVQDVGCSFTKSSKSVMSS